MGADILGVRSVFVALSISLVAVTLAIALGLTISSGETALDDTKSSGRSGLQSTRAVCSDGLHKTNDVMDKGIGACFDSGRENAEYLGGQMMQKQLSSLGAELSGFVAVPVNIAAGMLNFMNIHDNITEHFGNEMWKHTVLNSFLMSQLVMGMPHGITTVHVLTTAQGDSDDFTFMEDPRTINAPWPEGTKYPGTSMLHTALNHDWAEPHPTLKNSADGASADITNSHSIQVVQYVTECSSLWSKTECLAQPTHPPLGGSHTVEQQKCLWCEPTMGPGTGTRMDDEGKPWWQESWRNGYCSPSNGCDKGYDRDPSFLYDGNYLESRERAFRGHPKKNGQIDWNARPGNYSASPTKLFAVPGPLPAMKDQKSHNYFYSVLRYLVGGQQRENKLMWSPPIPNGPVLGLRIHSGWDAMFPVDYSDNPKGARAAYSGEKHLVGELDVALDIKAINGFIARAMPSLPANSRVYMVQRDPWKNAPYNPECTDDPHGLGMVMAGDIPPGMTACELMLNTLTFILTEGCDSELNWLIPTFPKKMFLWETCPKSCGRCPADMRAAGKYPDDQGTLMGASHGAADVKFPLEESSFGASDQGSLPDLLPLHAYNSSDPIIAAHANYAMQQTNYWDSFDRAQLHTWDSSASHPPPDGVNYWFRTHLTEDPYGLYIHTVLLVQRDEAMKLIDEATSQVQATIETDKAAVEGDVRASNERVEQKIQQDEADVEDKQKEDFRTMIIAVVIATVALMLLSIVFVSMTVKPLVKLSKNMQLATQMNLDVVDTTDVSSLHEIRSMQKSFRRLVTSLKEYMQYLPQSLTVTMEDDEAEDIDATPAPNIGVPDKQRPSASGRVSHKAGSQANSAASSKHSHSRRGGGVASTVASSQKSQQLARFLKDKMGDGTKKKKVTVVLVNIADWHGVWASAGADDARARHATFLEELLNAAMAGKGVADSFAGDRVLVGFNALKQCGTHKKSACGFADAAVRAGQKGSSGATVGAAAGDAQVGNMGCMGMKKYTIVSVAIPFAAGLERYARRSPPQVNAIAVDDAVATDDSVRSGHHLLRQGCALMKKRSSHKPIGIWLVLGSKNVSEDEWMYQLEEAAKQDPYRHVNKAAQEAMQRTWDSAAEHWKEVDDALRATPEVQWLVVAMDSKQYHEQIFDGYH